jgi:Uncharacterized protein conserved in bacteria (DUF2314)
MAREPASNIGMFCAEHSPKPDPKFAGLDPQTLIGRFVKKGFKTADPRVELEHMWVKVKRLREDGKLEGVLNNDPGFCPNLKNGDIVTVEMSEIEAIYKE